MSTYNWETIEVPRGAFISWGNQTGQHVTGKVTDFDPTGGTDAKGLICPQLSVELVEPAASINKEGQRTDFPVGEFVILNCSQVSLKRAIKAADPKVGDLVKITLSNLVKATNGTVKEFDIKIARGAGGQTQQSKPSPFDRTYTDTTVDAQPPF